ncbi:anaerobic ribonucleoside-triphosphate reductase activating protein [Candidatus Margulisiibacteriota bacterium]
MDLEIKGFIETSFIDWDGKVVSTLYVPLCNMKCPFCHNSGLVEKPGQYATIPIEHIKGFLLKHKDFVDGICLTGGEPFMHKDRGLFEFIGMIKDLGFKVKLDTNGTDPDALKKAIDGKLVDYVAMDIKAPFDDRYHKLCGKKIDLHKIKESAAVIMKSGILYEFRTTVVPDLLSTKDIEDIARGLRGAQKFVLQQFAPENTWDESLREARPYPKEKLEEMAEASKPYIKNTLIRGVKEVA